MRYSQVDEQKIIAPSITKSIFSNENDTFTSLSMSALLAKSEVPVSHKKAADNYIVIKRIYKFQVVHNRISNQDLALLKKYDLNTLECSTIKNINEELAYLKNWSAAPNEALRHDADEIINIRAKELKYIVASNYSRNSNEVYDGYKALERYFEEITKFRRIY